MPDITDITPETAVGGAALAVAGAACKAMFDWMAKRGPNRQQEVNEFLQRLQDELDSTRERLDKVEARNDILTNDNHAMSIKIAAYEFQVVTLRTERDSLIIRVSRMEDRIRELEHE